LVIYKQLDHFIAETDVTESHFKVIGKLIAKVVKAGVRRKQLASGWQGEELDDIFQKKVSTPYQNLILNAR